MAATWRDASSADAGTASSGGSGAPVTAPLPAAAQAGDVALLAIAQNGTQAITAPSGWSQIAQGTTSGNNLRLTLFKRDNRLTSGDISTGSIQFNFASSQRWAWAIATVSAASDTDVVATPSVVNTATTSVVAPAVDPNYTGTECLVFATGRNATNGTIVTWSVASSGLTERVDRSTSAAAAVNTSLFVGSKDLSADTSTGTFTITASASVTYVTMTVAVMPILTAGHLGPAGALRSGTLAKTISLTGGHLGPAGALRSGTLAKTLALIGGHLGPAGALRDGTLTQGTSLTGGHLGPLGAVRIGSVAPGNVNLTGGHLGPAGALRAGSVAPGGIQLSAGLLGPAGALRPGSLGLTISLTGNRLGPLGALRAGTITTGTSPTSRRSETQTARRTESPTSRRTSTATPRRGG